MNKEVKVEKSNLPIPAEIAALATLGQVAAATAGSLDTSECYGGFAKGEWLFGQEKIEVQPESEWAINPMAFTHGFIYWPGEDADGKPHTDSMQDLMVPAAQPLPQVDTLPQVQGEWSKNAGFNARCMNGDDEGQQVQFKGSSLGFRKAWGLVLQAVAKQAVEGSGEVVPVVEFDVDSYVHKKHGKIWTPVITIKSWLTMEGLQAEGSEEGEGDAEPASKPPKPEAKVKKAEPARRRRRRKAV